MPGESAIAVSEVVHLAIVLGLLLAAAIAAGQRRPSAAQVLPALVGAILAIPGGFGLITAVDPDAAPFPPLWQLLALVTGTVLGVAGLTAIPARIGAGHPVAEILRSELA